MVFKKHWNFFGIQIKIGLQQNHSNSIYYMIFIAGNTFINNLRWFNHNKLC